MNGHKAIVGATPKPLDNRLKIHNSTSQIVFIDEGKATPANWTVCYLMEQWRDRPTCRHGNGTNLGFADGYGEYWKRTDPRTINIGTNESLNPQEPKWGQVNKDLHRVQRGAWGKLGYPPSG